MRPRLALIVGHSKVSPGAVSADGLTEYAYNSGVARLIWEAAEKTPDIDVNIFTRDGSSILSVAKLVNTWVMGAPRALALELHLNSCDNVNVTGSEVLYDDHPSTNRLLAKGFQASIVHLLGTKDRGIKLLSAGDRGYPSLETIECPSVLLEPNFLSNKEATDQLRKMQSAYADMILETAHDYLTRGE